MRVYNPGKGLNRPYAARDVEVPTGVSEHGEDEGSCIVRDFAPLGVAQLGLTTVNLKGETVPTDEAAVIANADAHYRARTGDEFSLGELARKAAKEEAALAAPAESPSPEAAPSEPTQVVEPVAPVVPETTEQ